MGTHVVIGGGAVGQGTATELAEYGHEVVLVTRSGTPAQHPAVRSIAADAGDPNSLTNVARKIEAIYNCANPSYHRWEHDWPPLAGSMLQVAEQNESILVTMSNLYGYGPVEGAMTESHPLNAQGKKGMVRAQMWMTALAAHQKGSLRATEARASDFIGAGLGKSAHMGSRAMDRALAGKTVSVVGSPKMPHSWTAINDVARLLARLGTDPQAWGKPWHVPTAEPLSAEELIHRVCEAAQTDKVKVRGYSKFELSLAGLFSKTIRELEETYYQFEQPFILDSSLTSNTFDLKATSTEDVINAIITEATS